MWHILKFSPNIAYSFNIIVERTRYIVRVDHE